LKRATAAWREFRDAHRKELLAELEARGDAILKRVVEARGLMAAAAHDWQQLDRDGYAVVRIDSQELADRLDAVAARRGLERSELLRQLVVEATFTAHERAQLPDEDELVRILGDRARAGNVAAIRLLLERQKSQERPAEEADPFAELDRVWTERRAGRVGESEGPAGRRVQRAALARPYASAE
jgi:hypothetical protein